MEKKILLPGNRGDARDGRIQSVLAGSTLGNSGEVDRNSVLCARLKNPSFSKFVTRHEFSFSSDFIPKQAMFKILFIFLKYIS